MRLNKNVDVPVDDRYPVLPAHTRCAAVPPTWRRLPDSGHDPCCGVRLGTQVRPARTSEAIKTERNTRTERTVCLKC